MFLYTALKPHDKLNIVWVTMWLPEKPTGDAPVYVQIADALASLDEATLLRLEHDLASLIAGLAADAEAAQVPLAQL